MPTSFRVFLNHPETAAAIHGYGHYLRFGAGLSDRNVELVVMRTAALTGRRLHVGPPRRVGGRSGLHRRRPRQPEDGTGRSTDDPVLSIVDATVTAVGDDASFAAARQALGDATALDVAVLTGYLRDAAPRVHDLGIQGNADTRGNSASS
jgi:hypothetical protein